MAFKLNITLKKRQDFPRLFLLERSFCDGDDAGAFGYERREHSEDIGRVVVEVLGGEAERGEFCHCPAIILVTTLALAKIEVTNGWGMLLNTGELRHVRGSLLVAHIYAISVLLFEDAMHVLGVLFSAIFIYHSAYMKMPCEKQGIF